MSGAAAAEERLANDPRSELWGEHRARYRLVVQRGVAGQRVLDLACGAGFGLEMLRQAGARVVGGDLDWTALRECGRTGHRPRLVRADGTRLPFPEGCFDTIVSMETLEHVPDAAALLRELARVVASGGELVLSTPNRAFGPAWLHEGNPFHVQEFTADELRALLVQSFGSVEIFGQHVDPHYRFVPFLMVEPGFDPLAMPWKLLNRSPYAVKDRLARLLTGRGWYPGAMDWTFERDDVEGSHALLAIAREPRR